MVASRKLTVELGTSCYAGALMLQAMGLGGWMFNGVDPFAVLGASGDPDVPGLGFRYDTDERWPYPNPTGLEGVMEGFCPPHYPDMRAAVEAVCERKFGPGGPFHPDTPGPWKDSRKVRSAAQVHDERFRECVALQAQYVYDTFGKFPGTVPSMFLIMYLQAHHLDLDFMTSSSSRGPICRPMHDTRRIGTRRDEPSGEPIAKELRGEVHSPRNPCGSRLVASIAMLISRCEAQPAPL